MAKLLGQRPRRSHEIVVQDPSAVACCVHFTLRLVIQTLFHCVSPGSPYADCLPTEVEPGIYGHVAGYLGVVEPQMVHQPPAQSQLGRL